MPDDDVELLNISGVDGKVHKNTQLTQLSLASLGKSFSMVADSATRLILLNLGPIAAT